MNVETLPFLSESKVFTEANASSFILNLTRENITPAVPILNSNCEKCPAISFVCWELKTAVR